MVMPMCSDGVEDMFPPNPWNLTAYIEGCQKEFGVTPQPYYIQTMYGGKEISSHTNIIFRYNTSTLVNCARMYVSYAAMDCWTHGTREEFWIAYRTALWHSRFQTEPTTLT